MTCCSRHVTVMDTEKRPVTLSFDLLKGNIPLIIGMDIKQYSDTYSMDKPSSIALRGPGDRMAYTFPTYLADDNGGNKRLRLGLVAHINTTLHTLLVSALIRKKLTILKRIHAFGHGNESDMMGIIQGYELDRNKL